MNANTRIVTVSILAFMALMLLGFWVGAFETFGGHVWRQWAFLWASLAIGLMTALLLARKWKVHYALAGTFFLLSHFMYVLGQAFGQAYYVGFGDARDFVRTVFLALNNQL
jgi:hypothetical protein